MHERLWCLAGGHSWCGGGRWGGGGHWGPVPGLLLTQGFVTCCAMFIGPSNIFDFKFGVALEPFCISRACFCRCVPKVVAVDGYQHKYLYGNETGPMRLVTCRTRCVPAPLRACRVAAGLCCSRDFQSGSKLFLAQDSRVLLSNLILSAKDYKAVTRRQRTHARRRHPGGSTGLRYEPSSEPLVAGYGRRRRRRRRRQSSS